MAVVTVVHEGVMAAAEEEDIEEVSVTAHGVQG